VRETSPFVDKARRGVVWLEPELQAEITYAKVTQGLRAPVFRRLVRLANGSHLSCGTTIARRSRTKAKDR